MWCLLTVRTNWLPVWLNFCEYGCQAPLALSSKSLLSLHVSLEERRSDALRFLGAKLWVLDFGIWLILMSDGFENSSGFVNVLIIEATSFHFIETDFHSFLREVVYKILFVFWVMILLVSLMFFLEIFMIIGFDVVEVPFRVEFLNLIYTRRMSNFGQMKFLFVNYHLHIMKINMKTYPFIYFIFIWSNYFIFCMI